MTIMKPEEILPNINSESVIRIGDDEKCLTLEQFRETITTAIVSMKVNYVQSLVSRGDVGLVSDMAPGDKFESDGGLSNSESLPYKYKETGEQFGVSGFSCFNSGEDCKILQPGEQWQEGVFRVRVITEFIPKDVSPDHPIESSLDDFREIS